MTTNKDKIHYQKHIELAVVITLSILIILFQSIPKRFTLHKTKHGAVSIDIVIQDVPITTQHVRRGRPRPQRPAMPVESEDPDYPEDVTIDETEIIWDLGDHPEGTSGLTTGRQDTIPPRPVLHTLPVLPENLGKQKITGAVILLVKINNLGSVMDVKTVSNTTGIKQIETISIKTAFQSRYQPAKYNNKAVIMWTRCEYNFGSD